MKRAFQFARKLYIVGLYKFLEMQSINRINQLPDDLSQKIWGNVFDQCVNEVLGGSLEWHISHGVTCGDEIPDHLIHLFYWYRNFSNTLPDNWGFFELLDAILDDILYHHEHHNRLNIDVPMRTELVPYAFEDDSDSDDDYYEY